MNMHQIQLHGLIHGAFSGARNLTLHQLLNTSLAANAKKAMHIVS
jgi:hypothetical protein